MALYELMLAHFPNPSLLAAMCAPASNFMKPIVEEMLGVEAYLTAGAVQVGPKWGMHFTEDELAKWLKSGVPMPAPNLHVWLTLGTMDIVDFTFLYTLGSQNPCPLIGSPDVLHRAQIEYRPVVASDDFVDRLNLATSACLKTKCEMWPT